MYAHTVLPRLTYQGLAQKSIGSVVPQPFLGSFGSSRDVQSIYIGTGWERSCTILSVSGVQHVQGCFHDHHFALLHRQQSVQYHLP
jgi:hypothetical protein